MSKVKHWHRFGMDRLYVNSDDGARIGWADLQTGRMYTDLAADPAEVRRAVEDWQEHPHGLQRLIHR